MLVLSRKQNDKVLFPNLGITVEILRISGNAVRVGIQAPENISVLRHEIAAEGEFASPPKLAWTQRTSAAPAGGGEGEAVPEDQLSPDARHALRNRLHSANLALHLLREKVSRGEFSEDDPMLLSALEALKDLDSEIGAGLEGQRARALVVEDNANEGSLLAACLRMHGYDVATANDGMEALDYLEQHGRPDIVLLDMRMPRLDGPSTIDLIRQNPRYLGLKIYAVSGTPQQEAGVPTGPAGVDRWFAKPVDPQVLVLHMAQELSV